MGIQFLQTASAHQFNILIMSSLQTIDFIYMYSLPSYTITNNPLSENNNPFHVVILYLILRSYMLDRNRNSRDYSDTEKKEENIEFTCININTNCSYTPHHH